MKDALTRDDALPLTQKLAADLEAAYETITGLDAQIGDGDLGVTCRLGMKAALDLLPTLSQAPVHEVLLRAGMAFNSAGASTFGALVATGAMRAAKYLREQTAETVDLAALAGALRAAVEGIQQRGKAAQGEKTLLDSLWPAIEAIEAAGKNGKSFAEALADAAVAAEVGAESTRPLRSKFGRAAWMQDRTIGVKDAGASVMALVMKSLAEYARG
ncbi:MAG: dihydroxyacetone kinase subunit L [Candidatus Methylomirabilota bacterium]|jgi:dihydroxyacetone kinase-like protein